MPGDDLALHKIDMSTRGHRFFWTEERIAELIELAKQPGKTLKDLGKRYHVSADAIAYVLRREGRHFELSGLRREWRRAQVRERYRREIPRLMLECRGIQKCVAKKLHLAEVTVQHLITELFTHEERLAMMPKRGCLVCGKPIESTHWRTILCSQQCRIERHRQSAKRIREQNGHGWMLWKQRDAEMMHAAILRNGGSCTAIAKEFGATRYSVSNAIRRWGLGAVAEQARKEKYEARVQTAAELLRSGATMAQTARDIGMNEEDLSRIIHERYADIAGVNRCKHCGQHFKRDRAQARHCSDACARAARQTREKRADKKYKMKRALQRQAQRKEQQRRSADASSIIVGRIQQIQSSTHL